MKRTLVVTVVLLSLVVAASAQANMIPDPLPRLNGDQDRVHTYYASGSWRAPSSINWIFPKAVRMQGGEYAFAREPVLPGEIKARYWIEVSGRGARGSVRIRSGSIGAGYSGYVVKVRCEQHRVIEENGRIREQFLWDGEAEGRSGTVPIGVRNVKVGRHDGRDIRISFGGNLTGGQKGSRELLAEALQNALFNMVEQPQRRVSPTEPIFVTEVREDSVIVSAGAARGIVEGQTYAVYPPDQLRQNPATGRVKSQTLRLVAVVQVVRVFPNSDEAECRIANSLGTIQAIRVGYALEPTDVSSGERPRMSMN